MIRTVAVFACLLVVPVSASATGRTYYLHRSATPVTVPGGTTLTYVDGTPAAGGPMTATKIATVNHGETGTFVYVGTPFASATTIDAFVTATAHLSANQPMNGCAQVGFSLARVSASGAMTVLGSGSTPPGQTIPQGSGGGTVGFAAFSASFSLAAADRVVPAGASIALSVAVTNGCSNRGITLTTDGAAPSRVDFAGCGDATLPTGITTHDATLHAEEDAMGACFAHFQYWQDGNSVPSTTTYMTTSGVPFADFPAAVTGLTPGALYHYEICGYDTYVNAGYATYDDFPGFCTGPLAGGAVVGSNPPGTVTDGGNLDATANFRTAGSGTKATIDLGALASTADTASAPISRDGGFSVPYASNPPLSLWLFGDTQQNHFGFIPYGTAIEGAFTAGRAPTGLAEVPTPPAAPHAGIAYPSPFFPAPAPLLKLDGTACGTPGTYAADWVMGGAALPGSSLLLLVWGELCIESSPLAFTLERVAFAEYDPATNVFVRVDHPFVASPLNAAVTGSKAVASPVFGGDGYLYVFAAECVGSFCSTKGAVDVARVPADPSSWSNGASFTWWNGSGWTSDSAAAASVIPGVRPLGGLVQVADYSATSAQKYVMMEQTGIGSGAFQAWEATSPTGPWTAGPAGVPPDACTGGIFGCYALYGHPELSTSSQLVFSWFSVDDRDGYGRVRIGAVDW